MARRRLIVGLGSALAAAGVAAAFVGQGGGGPGPAGAAADGDPARCAGLTAEDARSCYDRELTAAVTAAADPAAAVEEVAAGAYAEPGGYLLANCHGIMHAVGRRVAARRHVTLASLMEHLPRGNDPACTAGFAHGLVTGVAPEVGRSGAGAERVCGEAATRFQRYSCTHGFGHAFMRLNDGELEPALELCRALGPGSAPDCAQGAYHDYWFGVKGLDDAPPPSTRIVDPRRLCARQPAELVRPCWYRAFAETREDAPPTASAADLERSCGGLRGLQRQGCVTGAMLVGPADPREQLAICREVRPSDAASCIRGTKVQNMLAHPPEIYPLLIGDCARFREPAATACYRWLGKALGVITDGEFGRTGCPLLRPAAARRACRQGVRSMDGPLVTLS